MKTYTINDLKRNGLIIFETKMGSHAYGTALPTSDVDIRGVWMQPINDIVQYGHYDQVEDETNDTVYYELRRFLYLASENNPNIIELLFAPDDCIIKTSKEWEMIHKFNKTFITKRCLHTFGSYAIGQIKKAKGYNKKINWEDSKITRKNVIDFCFIVKDNGSIPFSQWLESFNPNLTYKDFALSAINHVKDLYAIYNIPNTGIVSDLDKANDVQLVSIPKETEVKAYLYFNKDGYSSHCRHYKEYQTWLKERNEDRFKMNKDHGKNYDSKNMMHTFRLLKVALEIPIFETIRVRRPNDEINILMKIRRGEYPLDELLTSADEMISQLNTLYTESSLPEKVDEAFISTLLLTIRNYNNRK